MTKSLFWVPVTKSTPSCNKFEKLCAVIRSNLAVIESTGCVVVASTHFG